jgi:predicted enzyme related to lactoylglutathione lyase
MANQGVWFDMPIDDLDRAIRFYSAVLGAEVQKQTYGQMSFATLPHKDGDASGCLTPMKESGPRSANGPLLYFNCDGRLDQAIAAVEPNGGKVQQAKHQIGPYGFRAVVVDSEGNRIALHSN